MPNHRFRGIGITLFCTLACLVTNPTGHEACAGEVRTNSGFVISGRPVRLEGLTVKAARQSQGPVTIKHVWMVDDGMRRTFVPQRQVDKNTVSQESLITVDEFEIRGEKGGRVIGPSVVGTYLERTPFDRDGRRRVTLAGSREPIHVLQEITKLRPDIVTVNSTSHKWTYALTTRALDDETLLALLMKAIDRDNYTDRRRVVAFLIDAERYTLAQQQLAALRHDFPEMAARADEFQQQLNHLIAVKALGEVQQRRRSGQHQFAYVYAQKFPRDKVSAEVQRQASEIIEEYRVSLEKIDTARTLLGQFQAELTDEQASEVSPLRSLLCAELSVDTIKRLEPFLRSELDDTLSAEEKLGLAYTGWLLGDARAEASLPLALRLWRTRFLVNQYLQSDDDGQRQSLLRELNEIDGASVENVAAMVPQLPLPEEIALEPGVPQTIDVATNESDVSVRYSVVVPPEYSPGRQYPLLIVLRDRGMSGDHAVQWWAGTPEQPGSAMRHGYIVIAPDYAEPDADRYTYGALAHQIVLATLNDVRRRLQVDSDRVFLTGHGMGGDAAFDIGMSHPDLFAGVLPIVGLCDQHCKVYWKNCRELPWYIVGGEKDRDSLEVNATVLNRMMIGGYDITYVEYIERGYETYFEERPRMFEWMALHRRATEPKEISIDFLRPLDANRYWVEVRGFRENALQPVAWSNGRLQTRAQTLHARIFETGRISVGSGASQTTIKLSPSLVNLSQRIRVDSGSKQVVNEIVKPDLHVLLEDLRERADRQRLYWAQVAF